MSIREILEPRSMFRWRAAGAGSDEYVSSSSVVEGCTRGVLGGFHDWVLDWVLDWVQDLVLDWVQDLVLDLDLVLVVFRTLRTLYSGL